MVSQHWSETLYIEPGSPRENGYCESFKSKLRDESLSGEIFYSIKELRVLADRWRALKHSKATLIDGIQTTSPETWQTIPWGSII